MIALADMRSLACPNCAGHLPDTADPEAEDRYVGEDPTRCYRCQAIALMQDQHRETPQPQSLLFRTRRR